MKKQEAAKLKNPFEVIEPHFEEFNKLSFWWDIGEKYLKGKKEKSYMITSKNDISEISDTSIYVNNKVSHKWGDWEMKFLSSKQFNL